MPLESKDFTHHANFTVSEGDEVHFTLTWTPSSQGDSRDIAYPEDAIEETVEFWKDWASHCTYHGPWKEAVLRSLLTLKALTYEPTGGIIAALTTSLPERIGGSRNWDYRYCWLRDATFTLYALLSSGYRKEAEAWREWLVRAVAGVPSQLAIVYGLRGEQRLPEQELSWLTGFEGSLPVRIGNDAHSQLQLDVFGEVMDALHLGRKSGLRAFPESWNLQLKLLDYLEGKWREPDSGIWETRGPRQHFVFSKVMAWVALDRGIKAIEMFGRSGPLEKWRAIRDEIHKDVCNRGFDSEKRSFVQAYGSQALDSSLLLIPLVGFLPVSDPRVSGTIRAIERELMREGLLLRYKTSETNDGLPGTEGAFLACTFWYADCLVLEGKISQARKVFERLLSLTNDVGLLSEEYDPVAKRQLGNFPQALSHIALINSARNIFQQAKGPAEDRSSETDRFEQADLSQRRSA